MIAQSPAFPDTDVGPKPQVAPKSHPPALGEGESASAPYPTAKLLPSADPRRMPSSPGLGLGLLGRLRWRWLAAGIITVRVPDWLRPSLLEPRACSPGSWGNAKLGERYCGAVAGPGLREPRVPACSRCSRAGCLGGSRGDRVGRARTEVRRRIPGRGSNDSWAPRSSSSRVCASERSAANRTRVRAAVRRGPGPLLPAQPRERH